MEFKLNDYTPGEALRIIREWSELTQSQFAQTIHKSYRTLQAYENDEFTYNMHVFKEIMAKHGLVVTIRKRGPNNG